MKMRFGFAVLFCAFVFVPAISHGQTAEDLKTIRECLTKATADYEKRDYGDKCIGLVAEPCIKTAMNDWDATKRCARREYLVWTVILKDAVQLVRKGGFAQATARVERAQKNRPAIVEDICVHFDNMRPEYSIGGADYCRLRETASHALTVYWLGLALTTPP